jgi:hypothetical protein
MDLAADLAEKFGVESLEMFDALKDVWSNANKADFNVAKRKAKVCVCMCALWICCWCVRAAGSVDSAFVLRPP